AVDQFLHEQANRLGDRGLRQRVAALGRPPYLEPNALQKRAALLIDLGTIERGRTFNALAWELLVSLIRTYGPIGAAKTFRNLNLVQRTLLPEVASLDLLGNPPRLTMPVHYIFGERDALMPGALVTELPAAIGAPGTTVTRVPDAGHMVHFDRPDIVRSI